MCLYLTFHGYIKREYEFSQQNARYLHQLFRQSLYYISCHIILSSCYAVSVNCWKSTQRDNDIKHKLQLSFAAGYGNESTEAAVCTVCSVRGRKRSTPSSYRSIREKQKHNSYTLQAHWCSGTSSIDADRLTLEQVEWCDHSVAAVR